MAFDANTPRIELRNVRAPSRLFDPVTEVFESLNQRVLLESARLAKEKAAAGEVCIIERKDVLNAARVVLAQAASEIEKALGGDESELVRKAS